MRLLVNIFFYLPQPFCHGKFLRYMLTCQNAEVVVHGNRKFGNAESSATNVFQSVLRETETISQIFPTASQNAVKPHFTTILVCR